MSSSILSVIIASFSLLLFGVFVAFMVVFYNKKMIQNKNKIQQLELEKAKKTLIDSIQVQEDERARIGSDIHDDLGPTLSAMKLKINKLSSEKLTTERDVSQLKMMVDETIKSVRSVSHSLYPNTLKKYGLKTAIEELANRVDSENLTIQTEIDPGIETLEFYAQINIYRILQEFCNNSIKYSGCSQIEIQIQNNNGAFAISATDNGRGFDTSDTSFHGIGIRNMEMRANAINYTFELISKIGAGTKIVLQPINS